MRCSHLLLVLSLLSVLKTYFANCGEEGDVRLDPDYDAGLMPYYLLQVCLLGKWSYVCQGSFNHTGIDKNVVLQQLNCSSGGTNGRTGTTSYTPAYLQSIQCTGVEKRLINCPHNALKNYGCNKVQVVCEKNSIASRQCLNGELYRNETDKILYICINDRWKVLCPSLWPGASAQAIVACRQLNPRKSVIRAATKSVLSPFTPQDYFKYHFYCTGSEKEITDCHTSPKKVNDNLCSDSMVTALMCETGSVSYPTNLTVRAISSSSVEANWTQPSSDSVWQYYTNHTITCTSTHGVYTATQHVNVSVAVNESMHTIITGLMANTFYNCCVSVYSELGRSEDVCGSVITAGFRIQISVTRSTSATTKPTSVKTDAQCETNSSTLPWVAGIIIGAVLSAVILLTVMVAVYLWRKKSRSQYKMSDSSTERRVSLSQTNQYFSSVQEPQAYEEFQPNGQDHQPAAADGVYSYADHTVNTNVYDSVPQSNESSDCYGNSKEDTTMPTVDNIALYSLCEQENGAYSQLNRK